MSQTVYPSTAPVPEAGGFPVIGALPQVWKDPLGFFMQAGASHPQIVKLNLGPMRFYLVSHPDSVKYVLQDNNRNYIKGYDRTKPVLGDGLVVSEGETWRRQRRLMQPAFHRQRLAGLLPIMTGAAEEMVARWRSRSASGEPVDVAREMMLLTQNIIVRTMFSTDTSGRSEEIAEAFVSVMEYMNSLLFSPLPFAQSLPTPLNRRFRRAMRFIGDIVYGIIAERRASGAQRDDLLQMLIDARDEETGQGMSDRQMHDEILTIFLAGHETTATLLAWTFHLLAQHPQVEERVRAEMDTVLGGQSPDAAGVSALSYTGQVLHEALRMYPPAWIFARQPVEDDEIGGCRIPAGATVMLSPYVTQHLPEFWSEPDRFNPDRFAPEQESTRPRYAFFPFGGGPRLCIGNHFAMMEAPAILAVVMQSFRLKPAVDQPVQVSPRAILRPRPGVYMHLQG